jgi:uncharacterized glyoxalase superfamily protein PhnB
MKPQQPLPRGWPRLSAAVFYADARAAIEWLGRAFAFEPRLVVEGGNGRVEHSELEYGEAVVMVGSAGPAPGKDEQPWRRACASPRELGGRVTSSLALYVDDVDAHCATARAAGATICHEPTTTDYGADYWTDRSYAALDCEGHVWWFMQRLGTGGVPHAR